MTAATLIARQSIGLILREHTVTMIAGLFVGLVLISAWMGWQATTTVNQIFADAAAFLAASGRPVPTNPVLDNSPLILMRNLPVYVSLIGALAAIVIGNRLVALDRKAGILPLIGSRPATRLDYALGKIAALTALSGGLMLIAALVSCATFQLLPVVRLTALQWAQLGGFFVLSWAYILIFGLIALAATAFTRSESIALLVPVTAWLAGTFILPALTLNLTPTAVLNPISALADPPQTAFFGWMGWALGPLSLAEAYGTTAAQLLDFRPAEWASRSVIPALPALLIALLALAAAAIWALLSLNTGAEEYDA